MHIDKSENYGHYKWEKTPYNWHFFFNYWLLIIIWPSNEKCMAVLIQ